MNWKQITETDPPQYRAVLTCHKEDIYPVCAFRMDDGEWRRLLEGPEDASVFPPGYYEVLVRPPTHYCEIILP